MDLAGTKQQNEAASGEGGAKSLGISQTRDRASPVPSCVALGKSPWASVSPGVKWGYYEYLTHKVIVRINCDSTRRVLKTCWLPKTGRCFNLHKMSFIKKDSGHPTDQCFGAPLPCEFMGTGHKVIFYDTKVTQCHQLTSVSTQPCDFTAVLLSTVETPRVTLEIGPCPSMSAPGLLGWKAGRPW